MSSAGQAFAGLRVGFGLATAQLEHDWPPRLAGIELAAGGPEDPPDAVSSAVIDALLSACGLPELTALLDPVELAAADGDRFIQLSNVATALKRRKLQQVINLDLKLVCALSLPARQRAEMVGNLAAALGMQPAQISLSVAAEPLTPTLENGTALAVFAYMLCMLRTSSVPAQPESGAGASWQPAEPLIEANLPPLEETPMGRPREFERAVCTRLPPLPAAPPPAPGAILIAYTDGASRGNPGPAAAGWVVLDEQGRLVKEHGKVLGELTNNQAEYQALLDMARWVEAELGREFKLQIRMDSELVVKQLKGEYRIKDAELKQLAMQAMAQLMYFATFELVHVARAENSRADALANKALDEASR